MAKRIFDVLVASILLLIASPLLLVVAIAVRIKLGSPILFRQWRPGLNERPFQVLKFRTMREASYEDEMPLPDVQRLTAFGRFLRRTSMDELPELINVLRGEMSLVGPRPLLMEYLKLYTEEQSKRHRVRPGMTGWAQVNGRNAISWEEKFRHDLWYVEHHSISLDIRILWLTLSKVLKGDGITQHGSATAERFKGSDQ